VTNGVRGAGVGSATIRGGVVVVDVGGGGAVAVVEVEVRGAAVVGLEVCGRDTAVPTLAGWSWAAQAASTRAHAASAGTTTVTNLLLIDRGRLTAGGDTRNRGLVRIPWEAGGQRRCAFAGPPVAHFVGFGPLVKVCTVSRHPSIRDYVYVSSRKMAALVAEFPEPVLRRLTSLNIQAGPVGGGFSLAEAPPKSLIAAVPEVEGALRDSYHVRSFDDPELRNGHWFSADGLDMAYGVQRVPGSGAAAVFVASGEDLRVLLCGSAEFLLDRSVRSEEDVGDGMSSPEAAYDLLETLGEDAEPKKENDDPDPGEDSGQLWMHFEYPIGVLLTLFGRHGSQPMSFLARAIQVVKDVDSNPEKRYVVSTPLWVARTPPD
jgi:hypothetical protein